MATAELETTKTLDLTIAEDAIQEMAERYMVLTVTDANDSVGLAAVHEARMTVKRKRVEIEKKRKSLNEDALAWTRTVNTEAKRLTALLTPIEQHLEKEESIVQREKERLAKEAEERRQSMIRARLETLQALGVNAMESDVACLSPQQWEELVIEKQREKAERDKQAKLEAEERARQAELQRLEAERLATEREAIERVKREQAETQAKIDAEKRRLEEEEAKRLREAELSAARVEAAERAKREAKEKAAREAEEAKARAAAEEAERQRIEALRPDREKLLSVADALLDLDIPAVSDAAHHFAERVRSRLISAAHDIQDIAQEMTA